jgi:hypothetical protein
MIDKQGFMNLLDQVCRKVLLTQLRELPNFHADVYSLSKGRQSLEK